MPQFKNEPLKKALENLREDQSTPVVQKALEELMRGQVLAPAVWDKQPEKNEQGELVFQPDTKFSLMVVANADKELYFPMFTNMESLRKWNDDKEMQSLVLNFDQLMSFIEMSGDQVKGVVFDLKDENVPFTSQFLKGAKQAAGKAKVEVNTLYKGDKVYVQEPEENVSDLVLALSTAGSLIDDVQAIYFKERVYPEGEDGVKNHWFVIVDAPSHDTTIFEKIGKASSRFAKGKDLEFIFADTGLSKKIIENSVPIYKK